MNGIHDMGGMHGFGPIVREANEPVFHHDWERRVFAMRLGTPIPIPGGSRYSIERMDPATYLQTSYYEKWLHSRIQGLIDAGVFSEAELAERVARYQEHPDMPVPRREDPADVQRVLRQTRALRSPRLDLPMQPQFRVGNAIVVQNIHPPGHTRLPRYARGKRGVVTRYYGIYDLQDTMPAGVEAPAQPLYAVRFTAEELWGPDGDVNSVVYLDMWESYLHA